MKYIRTKDGRIFYARKKTKKAAKIANDNLHWEAIPKDCNGYFTLDYKDNEIIKVADTIEELCDIFVIVFKRKKIVEEDFGLAKSNYANYESFFGAIWTYDSNGAPTLKPVAKMNDKGELELL